MGMGGAGAGGSGGMAGTGGDATGGQGGVGGQGGGGTGGSGGGAGGGGTGGSGGGAGGGGTGGSGGGAGGGGGSGGGGTGGSGGAGGGGGSGGAGGGGGSGGAGGGGGSGGGTLTTTLYSVDYDDAQMEERFGYVTPSTGKLHTMSILPGVMSVGDPMVLNSVKGRFYLQTNVGQLAIDVKTGNVVDVSPAWESYTVRAHPITGVLYAVRWDAAASEEHFGTINPETGVFSTISTLPGVLGLSDAPGIDPTGKSFYLRTNLGWLTIDVSTGLITHVAPDVQDVAAHELHPITGTVYGLLKDPTTWEFAFGTLDLQTGVFTPIKSLPTITGHNARGGIDPAKNEYYVFANVGYVTIDITTGDIKNVAPNPDDFSNAFEYYSQ
ncbi:hypothetical protein [Polyangium jinanense]|uniref:Uncharacterized protein n=1 Tax=Polyangium jinanense TaxID=2829994 RepID=A0A9X3XBJ9_9BACT|nr:hypothetical protein [Polyangium jinanense]MDC3959269.1 hypothetical protein [Polyangium jinanense]MDC3987639.1 hypothetical protein [Polyangium jinanense]